MGKQSKRKSMSPMPSAPRVPSARSSAAAQVASDTIDWKRYTVELILAALVVAVFIIYRQTVHHGFTIVDDGPYVYGNRHVLGGLTWESMGRLFTAHDVGNWHPVTWFSHTLDAELFGAELNGSGAGWHHITSVVIHAATACMLFLAARRLTGALWLSALVAALFALHPLRVESVAWVAERKDVLSGLFCMLTLLAYARYAEKPGLPRYLLVVGMFVLGLMSKSMLVTLPVILLLLDIWPLKRWTWYVSMEASEKTCCPPRTLWQLILEKLPLLAFSGIVSLILMKIQAAAGAMNMVAKIPIHLRIANALTSTVMYLWQLVWPFNLAIFYPHPAVLKQDPTQIMLHGALAGLLLAIITGLVLWRWKRLPYLAVGWFWYLITLLPVIGLIQVGSQGRADRYTYIPMIGIAFALVWGGAQLISRWPRVQRSMKIVLPCLLIALMARSYHQTSVWRTDTSLFEHGCRVVENNYFTENHLGCVYWGAGALEEGGKHFQKAADMAPDYDGALSNLGLYYAVQRRDMAKALNLFDRALKGNPYFTGAWRNLARTHLTVGRREEGIAALRRTLEIQPEDPESLRNLGILLCEDDKAVEGLAHCRSAIQLNPGDPDLLGITAWFLATHPDDALRNGKEALNYALRAVNLTTGTSIQALDALGAAYAECGQFEKALLAIKEAQKLTKQPHEQGGLAAKLDLYGKHQPCRAKPTPTPIPTIQPTPGT